MKCARKEVACKSNEPCLRTTHSLFPHRVYPRCPARGTKGHLLSGRLGLQGKPSQKRKRQEVHSAAGLGPRMFYAPGHGVRNLQPPGRLKAHGEPIFRASRNSNGSGEKTHVDFSRIGRIYRRSKCATGQLGPLSLEYMSTVSKRIFNSGSQKASFPYETETARTHLT